MSKSRYTFRPLIFNQIKHTPQKNRTQPPPQIPHFKNLYNLIVGTLRAASACDVGAKCIPDAARRRPYKCVYHTSLPIVNIFQTRTFLSHFPKSTKRKAKTYKNTSKRAFRIAQLKKNNYPTEKIFFSS